MCSGSKFFTFHSSLFTFNLYLCPPIFRWNEEYVDDALPGAATIGPRIRRLARVDVGAPAEGVEGGHHHSGRGLVHADVPQSGTHHRPHAAEPGTPVLRHRQLEHLHIALSGDGLPPARPGAAGEAGATRVAAPECLHDGHPADRTLRRVHAGEHLLSS